MCNPQVKPTKGFKWVFEHQNSNIVKVFYITAYLLSFSLLVIQTQSVFNKWYFEPDIAQTNRYVAASEVPAPAITICSPVAMRKGFANYSELMLQWRDPELRDKINMTDHEKNYLAALIQVCFPSHADKTKKQLQNRSKKNFMKLLNYSSFEDVNKIFKSCVYKGNQTNKCDKFFNKVLTDDGFCYSLNMQDSSTIFNEDVISDDFSGYKRTKIVESLEIAENQQV